MGIGLLIGMPDKIFPPKQRAPQNKPSDLSITNEFEDKPYGTHCDDFTTTLLVHHGVNALERIIHWHTWRYLSHGDTFNMVPRNCKLVTISIHCHFTKFDQHKKYVGIRWFMSWIIERMLEDIWNCIMEGCSADSGESELGERLRSQNLCNSPHFFLII